VDLVLTLKTKRSLNTEQCFRARKAIEHLYYLVTVAGTPKYAEDEDIWIGWVKMGFDTSLREGPRGIPRTEKVRLETQVEPRFIGFRVDASNEGSLKVIGRVVERLEAIKESYQGKTDSERLDILSADENLAQMVLDPLVHVLGRHKNLRSEESQRIIRAAQDALVWLTDDDIISFHVN